MLSETIFFRPRRRLRPSAPERVSLRPSSCLISSFGAVPCLAVSNFGAGVSSANDGEATAIAASAANKYPSLITVFPLKMNCGRQHLMGRGVPNENLSVKYLDPFCSGEMSAIFVARWSKGLRLRSDKGDYCFDRGTAVVGPHGPYKHKGNQS